MAHKVTSIGSKRELIENFIDIRTIKIKLDIFEFLYRWLLNQIDVITLLIRGRQSFSIQSCTDPETGFLLDPQL